MKRKPVCPWCEEEDVKYCCYDCGEPICSNCAIEHEEELFCPDCSKECAQCETVFPLTSLFWCDDCEEYWCEDCSPTVCPNCNEELSHV